LEREYSKQIVSQLDIWQLILSSMSETYFQIINMWVEWDPFHPDLIASAPDATLAALACQVKLPLSIQIKGATTSAICLKTEPDFTMTILAGDRQYSILLDGQAQNPGPPSLRGCISLHGKGQARWLYELPGMATDLESDE